MATFKVVAWYDVEIPAEDTDEYKRLVALYLEKNPGIEDDPVNMEPQVLRGNLAVEMIAWAEHYELANQYVTMNDYTVEEV